MSEFAYRKAKVYVRYILAGIIEEIDSGYEFNYDSEYLSSDDARSVSLTMPISQKKYTSKVLFPFFDGLIPEGWMLDIAVENWKLNPNDRFGILIRACNDCIGDVQIMAEE